MRPPGLEYGCPRDHNKDGDCDIHPTGCPLKYSYSFIHANPPTLDQLGEIYASAEKNIWNRQASDQKQDAARIKYVEYCVSRGGCLVDLAPILIEPMQFVTCVHGDMTLENVLVMEDKSKYPRTPMWSMYFIDPGNPRGLTCRELDEAKILQSVLVGWEAWRRGWDMNRQVRLPFKLRPVHLALLYSHLLRLSHHHTTFPWKECYDILRHRWSTLRHESGDFPLLQNVFGNHSGLYIDRGGI